MHVHVLLFVHNDIKMNYADIIDNRVRRQSGFPTFIMARSYYDRTSATRYRCGDNRTKVKTFVTSAWYHWWHVGP